MCSEYVIFVVPWIPRLSPKKIFLNLFHNELSTVLVLLSSVDIAIGVLLITFPGMRRINRHASVSAQITNSWSTVPAAPVLIEVILGVCWR